MTSAKLDAAVSVHWPRVNNAADTTAERGLIFRVTTAAASTTITGIPANARGRYWRVLSHGASTEWGFICASVDAAGNDSAPTLVYGQAVTAGTGHLAAAPRLVDGIPEHVMCPSNAISVVFISSGTNGIFEASCSGKHVYPAGATR